SRRVGTAPSWATGARVALIAQPVRSAALASTFPLLVPSAPGRSAPGELLGGIPASRALASTFPLLVPSAPGRSAPGELLGGIPASRALASTFPLLVPSAPGRSAPGELLGGIPASRALASPFPLLVPPAPGRAAPAALLARVAVPVVAPNAVEDLLPRERQSRALCEEPQQIEFLGGELDGFVVDADLAPAAVDRDPTGLHDLRGGGAVGATQHGLHARDELS